MRLQYGPISLICEDSGSLKRALKLISSQPDSPANHLVWQGSEKAKRMKDISFQKSSALLANWDSQLSFWKMSRGLLRLMMDEPLARYSGRWPKWGMILDGAMYRQSMPARLTRENGCSCMLPTPQASDSERYKFTIAQHLRTVGFQGNMIVHLIKLIGGYLTALLYERMMGFPDDWTNFS